MVEKMSSDSGNRAQNALHRRAKAIKDWEISPTAKEKPERLPAQFTIKFDKGTVFLSAVASGEIDETTRLLDEGVDIDFTNVDGLTALHQACIDENDEMVELLLERGANIEAMDNEGWTPLHAAASAGNVDIAKILIEFGADLAAVNNEGEVPLDLVEDEDMEDFLSDEIDAQNLEVEEARNEEERLMMEDANSWLNQNKIEETLDWQGATALHVAAAKGYNKVISLLLQVPTIDVNIADDDGWTPLHAAVHWGSKTATELLTEAGANFDTKNNNGQTPCDLAEPDFVKTAENCRKRAKELAKKPNFTKNKRIELNIDVNDNSIKQKELLAIENLQKDPPRSALKGGREKAKNGNSNDSSKVKTIEKKDNSRKSSSSEVEANETKTTFKLNTSKSSKFSTDTTSSNSTSGNREIDKDKKITSSLNSRFSSKNEETASSAPSTTTSSTFSSRLNSRLSSLPSATTTSTSSTKNDEKKPETTTIPNRYSRTNKEERDNETTTTPSRTTGFRKTTTTSTDTPIATTSTTSSLFTSSTRTPASGSDWRSRLAERSKDAENDDSYSSKPKILPSTSVENSEKELSVPSNEKESSSERVSPGSRRVAHRNLRETRRSTGVVFLPEKEDKSEEDENDSTTTTTTTATDNTDPSRMSIAERLRKKNEQLIATSANDSRTSSYSSSRDTGGSTGSSSIRTSRLSSQSSTTNSSDTGDTKDLQRKLDQALKDVQDYKSKYEKMRQDKEDLETKLEQYKEDIDKMQELKNDNLRLKDENGALIRVISKLSRTPAS